MPSMGELISATGILVSKAATLTPMRASRGIPSRNWLMGFVGLNALVGEPTIR